MTMRAVLVAVLMLGACGGTPPAGGTAGHSTPATLPPAYAELNGHDGDYVDIDALVPADVVTIVDFSADYCGACKILDAKMKTDLAAMPPGTRVVRRDVHAGEEVDSPIMTQYKIRALPHVRIYDRQKNMRYVLVGNDTMDAVAKAIELSSEVPDGAPVSQR